MSLIFMLHTPMPSLPDICAVPLWLGLLFVAISQARSFIMCVSSRQVLISLAHPTRSSAVSNSCSLSPDREGVLGRQAPISACRRLEVVFQPSGQAACRSAAHWTLRRMHVFPRTCSPTLCFV
ncbi:hypothetical protein IWX90DRAFT_65752 [Phyllosticta citrichinensis]|uniref:Secreted protein n=1 Tax=Phyllosticta citrichinensis TaxID=1130410 RepID=A0ABR1XHS5_9PEZI